MQEIKYEVDDKFCISSPNLGDGEVRAITFSNRDVILKIYEITEKNTFSVEFNKVRTFSFNTNHPQNVIEGITVYPNRESMRLTHRNLISEPSAALPQAQDEVIVLVEPIAGPTVVCVCENLRIFLDN